MFTRVQIDNNIIQIKAGNDFCNTYKVGDSVPFSVNPEEYYSACFEDGVYSGLSESQHDHDKYYVVIKDSKIHAVLNHKDIEGVELIDNVYGYLREKYEINQELYSKECLEREVKRQQERDAEEELKRQNLRKQGLSEEEISKQILIEAIVAPLSISYNYQALVRSLLLTDYMDDPILPRDKKT